MDSVVPVWSFSQAFAGEPDDAGDQGLHNCAGNAFTAARYRRCYPLPFARIIAPLHHDLRTTIGLAELEFFWLNPHPGEGGHRYAKSTVYSYIDRTTAEQGMQPELDGCFYIRGTKHSVLATLPKSIDLSTVNTSCHCIE